MDIEKEQLLKDFHTTILYINNNDFIVKFLNEELSIGLDSNSNLDNNGLKEEVEKFISNDTNFKRFNSAYKKLNSIFNVAYPYSKIIEIDDFKKNLKARTKSNLDYIDNHYELAYYLFKNEEELFNDLIKNSDINYGGTFKLYGFKSDVLKSINDFIKAFKNNIKPINQYFSKRSKSSTLILPNCFENLKHLDIFVTFYSYNRTNNVLLDIIPGENKIESSNSFYFYFKEINGQFYLVLRQPFHTFKIPALFEAIEKNIPGIFFQYEEIHFIDFSEIEKNRYLHTPAGVLELDYVDFKVAGMNNLLSIKGEKPLDGIFKLYNDLGDIRINQLDLIEIKRGRSILKTNSVKVEDNKQYIERLFQILDTEKLLIIEEKEKFNFEKFFTKALFFEKLYIDKSFLNNITEINAYVIEYIYTGESIDELANKKIDLFDNSAYKLDLLNDKFTNIKLAVSDKITNNVKIVVNKKKLIEKYIKKYIKEIKNENDNILRIDFSHKLANTSLVFSSTKSKLITYLNTNKKDNVKILAFISEEEKTISDIEKINLLENYNCVLYGKEIISKFLNSSIEFLEQEFSNIRLSGDKKENLILNLSGIDIINLSKDGGEWEEFESKTGDILSFFFDRVIKLGQENRGDRLPDGIIFDKEKNNGTSCIFLYDTKATKNSVKKYVNNEVRKLREYYRFFPTNTNSCKVLIVFGKITNEDISKLSENSEWKEAIKNNEKYLFIGADLLDFLLYILKYPDFLQVKGLIQYKYIIDYIVTQVQLNPISQINFIDFYNKFKTDYIRPINGDDEERDLMKKMKDKEEFDITEIENKFRQYIAEYKIKNIE